MGQMEYYRKINGGFICSRNFYLFVVSLFPYIVYM